MSFLLATWPVMAQQANVIVPDGRTQTNLQTSGSVTNVTTGTVSGANAFNSFSQFGVGAGNTVNLQLPTGTQNLINLVHNAPAYVNGTLNSYANGQIGGNVYFADPYGFVVGRSGVVNVGSLNVSTPSKDFTDKVVGAQGQIDNGAVANLMSGSFPISPDGNIRIYGRINAADGVRLTGQNVVVGGAAGSRARLNQDHAAQFAASVNSKGLRSANGIVVRNGSIQIVAADSAKVASRLAARNRNGTPGDIVVTAGGAIRIAPTAQLIARNAHGNAGNIVLKAGGALSVATGATFDASSATGNAGIVEFSALGKFAIGSAIKVNVAAPNGKSGTLVIDPTDVVIGGADPGGSTTYYSNDDINSMVGALNGTGTLLIQADDTIVVNSGGIIDGRYASNGTVRNSVAVDLEAGSSITVNGVIDTRTYSGADVTGLLSDSSVHSTGNSAAVTLNAPTIIVGSTGKIYADVNNTTGTGATSYTGGNVSLTATTSQYLAIGNAQADSEITINGTITARSISAAATATAESVYALNANNDSPGDMATVIGGTLLLNLLPLQLTPGYVQSEGTAKVTVGGSANLIAQNDSAGSISLTAHTTTVSMDPALGLSNGSFLAGGVVVGSTRADTTVEIEDGAHVSGGGALTVSAVNDATVDIKSATISGLFGAQGALLVFSVAYGDSSVNASALIDSGAHIAMSGSSSAVNVLARNDNSFAVAASSYARNGGAAGTALAISDFNSSAVAHVGADLGTSTNKVGSVTILAQDETSKNQTSASATAGAGAFADALAALSTVGSAVGQGVEGEGVSPPDAGLLAKLFGFTNFGQAMKLGSSSLPMFAGGVSLSYGTQTSSASVAADLDNSGNRIEATSPSIYASGNVAIGSDTTDAAFLNLATSAVNSPKNGTSLNPSASLAVSAGIAYSEITHNSSAYIGPDVTVNAAKVGVAANSSIPSPIENIDWTDFGSVIDGLLANKSIVTTGANATSGSTGLGIAGSMDYALFTTNTTAWVGNGAQVTATSTNSNSWSVDLGGLDPNSGAADILSNFNGPLSVLATTTRETINVAGNLGLLGGNVANGAAAVGASLSMLTDSANTYAGIGQGAVISSGNGVDVEAHTYDRVVNASPVNGAGEGLNFSGLVDVFQLTDRTIASIGNTAQVTAASVTVNANEALGVYSIAGDMSFSATSGYGAAVTYNGIDTTTQAFIGDNSAIAGTAIDPNQAVTASAAGFVKTQNLTVDATTSGNVIAASVVSENVDSQAPEPPPVPSSSLGGQVLATVQNSVSATVSIALSGASAITDTAMDTEAYLDHVTAQPHTGFTSPAVQVQAVNNSLVVSGSGGSAIVLSGRPRAVSGALSGAISVATSSNTTLAYIEASSVSIGSVAVEALTSGLDVVAGIGLSVNTTEGGSSGTLAGSVSATKVSDRVAAYIDNSTISGSGDAIVLADQSTMLGVGGGSFAFGGKAGLGLAVTYIDLEDPSSGPATDAHISQSSVTGFTDIDVLAMSPQVIYAGAAAASSGTTVSLGGSFIFNTLDATTSATISNNGPTALAISANQTVNVIASTDPNDIPVDYNSAFNPSANQASAYKALYAADPNDSSASDNAAAALLSSSSAEIISVAGAVQAGEGTAVGISLINNSVNESHVASISGVTVSAFNPVTVAASDSTTITSIAVGVGASSDGYAFEGASVSNTISGGASATVGSTTGAPTTIGRSGSGVVGALVVSATDTSNITAIALDATLSADDPSAGVAISTNNIETNTAAAITNASVYTTYNASETFATGDIVVESQSSGAILAVAAGMAASGGGASANGSVTTNLANGNVKSSVSNSTLYATNNIGVLAANDNAINAVAGAAAIGASTAGIGISVTTNILGGTSTTGETFATVTNSTLDAAASGQSGLQIIDGKLVTGAAQTSSAPDSPSNAVTPAAVANLGQDVRQDHGIAVVAGSRETSISTAVTLGVSEGAAVAINVVTTSMGGITKATVTGSALDTNLGVSATPPGIDVSARSVTFANNFDYAVAFGNYSGAAVVVTNTINRTTTASVTSTDIGVLSTANGTTRTSAGAVTVSAYGWEGTSGEAIGVAGATGSAGLSGSALTNLFQGTTTATVDHGTIDAGGLSVTANGIDGFFGAVGAGAAGQSAGIGASVMVATSSSTTKAIVGDGDPTSAATTLNLTGPLNVAASTETDAAGYSIVGAIGGSVGVSAQFSGLIVNNETDAELYNSTVTISPSNATHGGVTVAAQETDSLAPIVGGGSAGGTASVGAAVNLVMLKSNLSAAMDGDIVTTPGAVSVTANSTRDVNPITVTASLGGQVSFAGTVGVVLIGSGASSDEMGVLNVGANDNDPNSGTLGNAGGAALTSQVDSNTVHDGISAQIIGGSITAGSVGVHANTSLAVSNIVGALSIGLGLGGVGAAVGFTEVSQTVTAKADDGHLTAPVVSVTASAQDDGGGHAADTFATAGAGGLYVGLGAAVAYAKIDNTVRAELGSRADSGSNGSTTATVAISASDSSTLETQGYGFAGGAAAAGISIANSSKTSDVTADIASSTTVSNFGGVMIVAGASGSVDSDAIGGAGGVVAGAGASATANDSETVLAQVGDHSSITAAGAGVLVDATAVPDVSSSSVGASLGIIGVGASVAMSSAALTVTADVGDNSTISGGALTITAAATVPSGSHAAYASAIAAVGGALVGVQGTYSQASDDSTVTAYGGLSLTLPSANVTIAAENDSNQDAEATGVSGGYLGVGATVTQSSSDAHTYAYLGAGAVTTASNTGSLSITATGTDSNTAHSIGGAGGIVAGAAAVATTSTTAVTSATLYGNGTTDTLYFGSLGINATHTSNYSANGDAYQASLVGASGGNATNTVASTTTAEAGTNLIINSAGGDMNVLASDTVNEASGGARAGSGGVLAGAATVSSATVTQTVAANVDTGTIFSLNDNPETSLAKINIEAYNFLQTDDTVSMTAGGLFAGGDASSTMNATAHDTVTIADSVELFSAGGIDIGTVSQMHASNNTNADLYGLFTGAGATSNTSQTAYQTVNVGAATIEGWGTVNIYAGQSGDGGYASSISSNATTVVYNYALIPATGEYSGVSAANNYTSLTLGAGSRVLGVGNILLGATPGSVNSNGNGTGYNPYLELFSTEVHQNEAATPITTGDVVIDGIVAAGIHNQTTISIAYNGGLTLSSGGSPYALSLEQVSDPSQFSPIISYNHQAIQYAVVNSFNPYQQIVDQLASLSGMSATDVQAQLARSAPAITASSDDAAGDNQRLINTLIQQARFTENGAGVAYAFGNIIASAGNVTILANTLNGTTSNHVTPTVSANDSVSIDFENLGTKFLFLSDLLVGGVSGGHVTFTGTGNDANSTGITYVRDLSGHTPTITVDAAYTATNNDGTIVDQQGHVLSTTPDFYFGGNVTNYNGLLNVTNQLGNVVITGSINAATVEMTVPKGSLTVPDGSRSIYTTNSAVPSQWANTEYMPGDVTTAVDAAATYLYSWYLNNYNANDGSVVNQSVYSYSDNSANVIFGARLIGAHYDGGGNVTSYIFLPTGYPNNDTHSTTAGTNGWQNSWYQNEAYGPDSGPFNCSGCGQFFTSIAIQQQAVTPVAAQGANNPPTNAPVIVGKAIILSASILNINGTISSGQSANYSVDIGSRAQGIISGILSDAPTLASDKAAAAAGNYVDLTPYISTVGAGDTKITAQYNALTNQILLNNVVQGAGGYVYLNGKIISTSDVADVNGNVIPQGNIIVNGGAGTVTVNNTSGTTLVTNTISTGVSAASVVEIVDQNKNLTTWYVYNPSAPANQQVTTYWQNGVSNANYQTATNHSVGANSGLSYAPLANQLYEWVDTAYLTRPVTNDPSAFGWTFTNVPAVSGTGVYNRSAPTVIIGAQSSNYQEVVTASGTYHQNNVSTGSGECCGADFNGTWHQDIYDTLTLTLTNTVKASYPIGITFNGGGTSNIAINSNASVIVNGSINNLQGNTSITTTGASSSITNGTSPFVSGVSVALSAPGGIGAIGAPLPIATYGGTFSANSIDHDIAVAATTGLDITHVRADPAVSGNAPQGNIFISATGDIVSNSAFNVASPIIVGKSIEIDSSGGAIGAVSGVDANGHGILTDINPIVIEATATVSGSTFDGGVLTSSSGTGAYIIQSTGDLRLGAISSNGPVFLEAAAANGQTANILNGLTTGGLTASQTAYLENVWTQLDLLGTANGNGPPPSVVSFQTMVTAAYNDYWQLRNLAFSVDGTYAISALGIQVIGAQLVAAGVLAQNTDLNAPSTQTLAAIQAEASNRFMKDQYLLGIKTAAQLGTTVQALLGTSVAASLTQLAADYNSANPQNTNADPYHLMVSTSGLATALGAFSSSFQYTVDSGSTLYSDLTSGSQWTQSQLSYIVSGNSQNQSLAPSITSLPINVDARQVMLYAPNGDIGSLAAPTSFTFTSDGSQTLTDLQKGLIATAGPGQLTVTQSAPSATGVITYTVSVAQRSLVKVSSRGTVAAKAQHQIYLGSETDLLLGGIPLAMFGPVSAAYSQGVQTVSGGDVLLQAVGSILGGIPGQVAISGNIVNLTLIAEQGSIGQASTDDLGPASNENALLLSLTGATVGNLDQAQAAHGIYIRQMNGDLVLGNITAGSATDSVLQLGASGSIYAESGFTDQTLAHIFAVALDVRAGGNVGFDGTSFQPLLVNISGAVTGSAVGAMTILSPQSDITIGSTGAFGTLSSGGALTVSTIAGSLTVGGDVTANGGALQLLANAAITFAAGTSAAPIVATSSTGAVTLASATLNMGAYTGIDAAGIVSISTTGDATIDRVHSSASYAAAGNGASIVIAAGGQATTGAILGAGDGRENVVADGANAVISLQASGDIGSATAAVALDTTTASIVSSGGNVFTTTAEVLHVLNGEATIGSFSLIGALDLTLDTLAAGTTLGATASGGSLVVGSATSGGTLTLHAGNNVTFKSIATTGITGDAGDVDVTADTGFILAQTVLSNGVQTQGSVQANGSASLIAATTNTGNTLTTGNGSGTVTGGGAVNWTSFTVAQALGVTSSGDSVTFGSANAGGTATVHAHDNVTFNQIATTGITGDVGDVDVTADTGFILAQTVLSNGVQTQGSVQANGSASLIAATTNTGNTLTASNGAGTITGGGAVNWTSFTVAQALGVTSSGDSIIFGSANAGGTATVHAHDNVTFNQIATTGNTGITGDAGDVNVNADHGFILAQTVLSNGAQTQGSVQANGSASLIAATTNTGNTLTTSNGSGTISGGGAVNWTSLTVAQALGVTSGGDSISFGSANAGGTATVHAHDSVTFNQIATTGITGDPGDVNVTADTGFILAQTVLSNGAQTQGSVQANGSASLIAATTNTGNTLTTSNGSGTISGGGAVNWTSFTVAQALGVTSSGDSIIFGSANAGGTATVHAHDSVTFNQIATTGITGDVGDVDVTTDTGFILAQTVLSNGVQTQGSVQANGSASLIAATTNTGNSLTASNGAGVLQAGGAIDWNTVNVVGRLDVTSTGDSITLGSANAGGTATVHAHDNVTFNQIATTGITGDAGDVNVNADTGFILAQTVEANGSASLIAATTNTGNTLTASNGAGTISGGGAVNWTSFTVAQALGVTSSGDSIIFGSANAGGTATVRAHDNVTFNQIATTGITGDAGDVDVNADHGFILAQTVLSNGVQTQGSVQANGSASLIAATTNTGNTLTAGNGSGTVTGAGAVNWTSFTVAQALGVTSSGDSISFGSANAGGTATVHANDNVTFNQIATTGITGDPGDVNVTADTGFILAQTVLSNGVQTQGSVQANGSASLIAATTNTGNTLTASNGAGTITGGGAVNWTSFTVAQALGVTSSGDSITLGSANVGGTATVHAHDSVTFNQIATTGITGDAGDVNVTADTGFILAQTVLSNGVQTQGSVQANGSASLIAATTNTGNTLTASNGAGVLQAGGAIDWNTVNVAGRLDVTSTGDQIVLGSATSGGTQRLHAAQDITFSQLTTTGIPGDAGDIDLTSDHGSVRGGSFSANGNAQVDGGVSIALDHVRAGTLGLSTPHNLTVAMAQVVKELDLAADVITVTAAQIPSTPPVPMHMTVSGFQGGVATAANVTVDPPSLIIDQFRVVDSTVNADAPIVQFVSGYVPGQMTLTTPTEVVLLDNRSPAPSNGPTLQLYQPGGVFTLTQDVNHSYVDTYVVFYTGDISSTVSTYSPGHTCCSDFSGSSFLRNIPNDLAGLNNNTDSSGKSGPGEIYVLGVSAGSWIDAIQAGSPVQTIGSGPAVNIDGLTDMKTLEGTESRRQRRHPRRDSELRGQPRAHVDFFARAN